MAERITWGSFPELRDFDKFTVVETTGTPGKVTLILNTAPTVTWWKALKLMQRNGGGIIREVITEESNHGPGTLVIDSSEYSSSRIVFAKAKIFGIHTDMYELFEIAEKDGLTLNFTWIADGPTNFWEAIGSFFSDVFSGLAKGVVTVINGIVTFFETVFGWIADVAAWFFGLLASIPVIGRFFSWLWNGITLVVGWIINLVLEFITGVAWVVGVRRIEKKLPLMVINQIDPVTGTAVATNDQIKAQLDFLIRLFQVRADIKVVPMRPWRFTNAFSGAPFSLDDFIVTQTSVNPVTLDVTCGTSAAAADLLLTGSSFQFMMNNLYWGGGRRLSGYGKGIVVFAVRSFVGGGVAGCSLGPLTDYVTVDFDIPASPSSMVNLSQYSVMAHEVVHSLGVTHSDDGNNLMFETSPSPIPEGNLNRWLTDGQVFIMRCSNRVSYS